MERIDKRGLDELRPIKITLDYTKYAEGSVLIEMGDTMVICNATVLEGVPPFKADTKEGWVTAEYSMLPRATKTRNPRDINRLKLNPRSTEIQRLIGRALRASIDFKALGERTINIDCDVVQADGGTRTASITGGFIALYIACKGLLDKGIIATMPIKTFVSAISVGIYEGEEVLDLCYREDSRAEVDMNIVMDKEGNFIELQGTGENGTFNKNQLTRLLELGEKGCLELIKLQEELLL